MIWLGLAACLAWGVLLLGRGMFWRARDDDRGATCLPEPSHWPAVQVIIPARDEAETIGATLRSLAAQDYPGSFRILVVDDRSTDQTGALARAAGAEVLTGQGRAAGWSGKLYALQQGLDAVAGRDHALLLFTDADITHAPDSLRRLVQRAEADRLDLVSLMARLRCESAAERWMIPAFVFFFQMLFPFRWSNAPGARAAAAAGGCVLLRRSAFEARGGLWSIRGKIIDDCALAGLMKAAAPNGPPGRIWTGLTERVHSRRAYPGFGSIRAMVARTAYAQLRYNPLLLAGTVLAMALVFLAPPLLALFGEAWAKLLGALAWCAMVVAYAPMLRRFGLAAERAIFLPLIACTYLMLTLDSAMAEWRGRGGFWKGEALSRE
ncbi:glycosyltransferase [Sediminicoccus sp. KRV36]|uniref:glycosyltransferase n=1 Tax=Sediminicoccus sp. KRV36 TaxID=3133721 RepID=UPI00200F2656|nr:glycosyltransferase [Sediminicoccus rosea]UPY35103.1 glycosyltransferase [Sediminicoccus rosea]